MAKKSMIAKQQRKAKFSTQAYTVITSYSIHYTKLYDIVSATSETVDSLMKLDLAPEIEVEIRSMDK